MAKELTLAYLKDYIEAAHEHSIFNKKEILKSKFCGCFYCLKVYQATEIVEWTDNDNLKGETALCSFCGIDSVIGDSSGFPISDNTFLQQMHTYYF